MTKKNLICPIYKNTCTLYTFLFSLCKLFNFPIKKGTASTWCSASSGTAADGGLRLDKSARPHTHTHTHVYSSDLESHCALSVMHSCISETVFSSSPRTLPCANCSTQTPWWQLKTAKISTLNPSQVPVTSLLYSMSLKWLVYSLEKDLCFKMHSKVAKPAFKHNKYSNPKVRTNVILV